MNSIFLRMKALLEQVGIEFSEHGISAAEIYAYASAIEMVRQNLQNVLRDVLIDDNAELEKYAYIFNIDTSRFTRDELINEIIYRLSMDYGTYLASDLEAEFDSVGSGHILFSLDYPSMIPSVRFEDVDADDLEQLGKFIEGFTCLSQNVTYFGNGMSFSSWGTWNKTFFKLDKLGLPFNIIDNLRSDMIE